MKDGLPTAKDPSPSQKQRVAAAASARDSDRIAGRCVYLPVRYADRLRGSGV